MPRNRQTFSCSTRLSTVNAEIFARVLFSRNLRSFVKVKASRIGEITLSFTQVGKSCPGRINMSFIAFRENKVLARLKLPVQKFLNLNSQLVYLSAYDQDEFHAQLT